MLSCASSAISWCQVRIIRAVSLACHPAGMADFNVLHGRLMKKAFPAAPGRLYPRDVVRSDYICSTAVSSQRPPPLERPKVQASVCSTGVAGLPLTTAPVSGFTM